MIAKRCRCGPAAAGGHESARLPPSLKPGWPVSVYIGRRALAPVGCNGGRYRCTKLEPRIVDRVAGHQLQGQDSCPTSERVVFLCINRGPASDLGGGLLEIRAQNTRGLQLLCVCCTHIYRASGHDVIDESIECRALLVLTRHFLRDAEDHC